MIVRKSTSYYRVLRGKEGRGARLPGLSRLPQFRFERVGAFELAFVHPDPHLRRAAKVVIIAAKPAALVNQTGCEAGQLRVALAQVVYAIRPPQQRVSPGRDLGPFSRVFRGTTPDDDAAECGAHILYNE